LDAARAARARWDSLAKPLGSLGLLEDAIVQIAALTGSADVCLNRRTLVVFCADNGVVKRGVTQCGSDVTASVARRQTAGSFPTPRAVCASIRCSICCAR
jgi:nicotinate-nucleotide--dimethylbenzimidazole phosphoribosyltransferase